jgi:hypothetical protein
LDNRFQREGSSSNTRAGREFEELAQRYFLVREGMSLQRGVSVSIGVTRQKNHKFDLGCHDRRILVECKSYKWTRGGNSPIAKIQSLNEAMLHFSVAPSHYQKILFLELDVHPKRGLSLGDHYVKNQGHLIGAGVEVWEYDRTAADVRKLWPPQ